MKILFVNAIDPEKEIENRFTPLGIGYMISSMRTRFGADAITFSIVDVDVERAIASFEPDIIGISTVSQNYGKAIQYARLAKRYNKIVICGGVHISMLPFSLDKDMDVGIIGEGEETICELVELYQKRKSLSPKDLQKMKGIVYWGDNGAIVIADKRELIHLDDIPFPAREYFANGSNTYMFTSRGCPYRCCFCASSRFWNKVRFFSAEYVVSEIQCLYEQYNVKRISFYDDLFPSNVERVRQIVTLLKQRDLLGKVDFTCAIRANRVNEEIISLLKKMGFISISIGLESGCEATLAYLKGNVSVRQNENAVKTIQKYNIPLRCSFVIGSPAETEEDIIETLDFIRRNQPMEFDVYVLTPFPGTPVWDYAKSRGLVTDHMDWDSLNVNFADNYQSAIILSERLSRREIYALFLKFRRYQSNKEMYNIIIKGLRNPFKIPGFLLRKYFYQRM